MDSKDHVSVVGFGFCCCSFYSQLNGNTCIALVNTGSTISLVKPGVLGEEIQWMSTEVKMETVTGQCARMKGRSKLTLKMGGTEVQQEFWLADIQEGCILGLDALRAIGAVVWAAGPQLEVGNQVLKAITVNSELDKLQINFLQFSEHYWLEVAIYVTGDEKNETDISTWLYHLFHNHLESCLSPNPAEPNTTSSTGFLQTTSVSPSYYPTHNMTTWSYDNTTTTAPRNFTTVPLTPNYSSTTSSNNVSTMTNLHSGKSTTSDVKTTWSYDNTTTAPHNFATVPQTQNYSSTTSSNDVSTITNLHSGIRPSAPSTHVTSSYNHHTTLDANYSMTTNNTTSTTSDNKMTTVSLFQGLEVSCINKTQIRKTICTVLLKLRQRIYPCCILHSLCLGGKNSTNIHVVGKRVESVGRLRQRNDTTECNSFSKHPNVCISTGPVNVSCPNATSAPFQISVLPNTTFNPTNTTSTPKNATTTAPDTTTAAANVTVTIKPNTTITTVTTVNVSSSDMSSMGPTTAPVTSIPGSSATTESSEGQANKLLELTRDVSSLNSSQVDLLVSQLEDLLAGPTVSLALGNTTIHIVSNLLDASPDTLASSSSRIIQIVDTVGLKLVLQEEAETILSQALALSVKTVDGSNFQETFFSISNPSNVQVHGDSRTRRHVRKESSTPQGSIKLPPSLTENLTTEQQQMASRVQFNFYQKNTVFQDRAMGGRRLNSGVLGASVANLSIKNLQEDIVIHLKNTAPIPGNFVATCVFWDFTRNDGSGGWNPNGCRVRNSTDSETICGCSHLTSFAILLDLSRKPITSRVQANILTYITYIGCGISAIFLSVTLLTYLAFGKLQKDIPSKLLIQLCFALLLLNLVFLMDAWLALYPEAVGLCISTAWFLHYFLLASFTWMGLEAVHMYLALVKVFNTYISHYMLKFSLVGWGIPLIVVIIVIAVDKDNYGLVTYGKFTDGSTDGFCWLKNDVAFYVAVVAYFCVIFLFNLIMFAVVMVQLCRIKRQNPHNMHHRNVLHDVRSVAGITILLGLTWGFAFFAWGPVNLPFMYLFAIFNSFQGFFIFVFHCAVKENVRQQWRTYLCCGKLRLAENSEWSRTVTQKTAKKSSVTRVTSLQSFKSSQSNNSSNSSSFLVSDYSEQLSGIGSPSGDRAITVDEDPGSDVVLNEINRQFRNQQASLHV
ncbi:adhesion G-protein coupled receptor G2-like [Lampris incognitus]|uniref:adhesion G-protein coupled receptor G2-like n=1 Tax=Lampris incognitus TaxID=2546036 RepID=UPI0024B5CB50|nr:adhesion G-protein coupled receptor G2-like [Lampris incognitus]